MVCMVAVSARADYCTGQVFFIFYVCLDLAWQISRRILIL